MATVYIAYLLQTSDNKTPVRASAAYPEEGGWGKPEEFRVHIVVGKNLLLNQFVLVGSDL